MRNDTNLFTTDFISVCARCGGTSGNCWCLQVGGVVDRFYEREVGDFIEKAIHEIDRRIEQMRIWNIAALRLWRRLCRLATSPPAIRTDPPPHPRTCALSGAWRARGPPV